MDQRNWNTIRTRQRNAKFTQSTAEPIVVDGLEPVLEAKAETVGGRDEADAIPATTL
jgi:hypothetical protein